MQELDSRMVKNTCLNSRHTRKRMDAGHVQLTAVLAEPGLAK